LIMNKQRFLQLAFGCAALAVVANHVDADSAVFFNPYNTAQIVDQSLIRHPTLASDSQEPVGVQLVLALDSSESMEPKEFEISLRATADALNSEQVRNAIKYKSGENSVALAVISFDVFAMLRVPWVDIRGDEINDKPFDTENLEKSSFSRDKLDRLADEIRALPRISSGGTSIDQALALGFSQFQKCAWPAIERKVLNVFGDGNSDTGKIQIQKKKLEQIGVTINGLAIVNEDPDLDQFYQTYLVTSGDTDKSGDGIYSQRGRVWVAAQNMPLDNGTDVELTAYYGSVVEAITKNISTEVAGTGFEYRNYAMNKKIFSLRF